MIVSHEVVSPMRRGMYEPKNGIILQAISLKDAKKTRVGWRAKFFDGYEDANEYTIKYGYTNIFDNQYDAYITAVSKSRVYNINSRNIITR